MLQTGSENIYLNTIPVNIWHIDIQLVNRISNTTGYKTSKY